MKKQAYRPFNASLASIRIAYAKIYGDLPSDLPFVDAAKQLEKDGYIEVLRAATADNIVRAYVDNGIEAALALMQ